MAQLSTIISSILRDMILAQHEANMYAVTLSDTYRKDGRMENFSLPSIALGEMELDLRYGVRDINVSTEQFEINYPELKKNCKELSDQLSRIVVASVSSTIRSAGLDDDPMTLNLIEQMDRQPTMQRDFCTFLSRKIFKTLQSDFTRLINEDGTVNQPVLLHSTIQVGQEELLYHPELTSLFGTPTGEAIREKAKMDMQTSIEMILPKLLKDINMMRKRLTPSLDVIINSEELSKLPEEAVHLFRFKVAPRMLNLSVIDGEDL